MNKRRVLTISYAMVVFLFVVYLVDSISEGQKLPKLPSEPVVVNKVLPATSSQTPKKYFIPLGAATVRSLNVWQDTGAQVYLDPADYPGATLTWEAVFKIPTANGRVLARLVNANLNWPVGGSEIWSEGNTYKHVSSGPLSLWAGNNLYKVQVITTMDYEAIMEGARIKISY